MMFKIIKNCVFAIVAAASLLGCTNLEAPSDVRGDSAYQLPIELDGSLQNPAWSPDGQAIVFTRFRNGYNQGPADVVVYDIESGTIKILVSDGSDNVNLPGSAWNQETDHIVFSSSREPHDEIYLIDANGSPGNEIKITERDHRVAYEPSFSPNGQWIVFETHEVDVEENGIITKYKIDGTELYQPLTDAESDCRQPNWSPEGQHILYQTIDNGQWEIWVIDSDGRNPRPVTSGAGDKTDASFSPDGQWIVFSADSPTIAYANLFMVSISGGEAKRVTNFNGYDGALSWSSNKTQIVFESSSGDPEDGSGTTIWMVDLDK